MKIYYYMSDSTDGYLNLARDEYLLSHLPDDAHLLYFYINKNAVIIGRNQNPWMECDISALKAAGVQLVRRMTGGGAVYHDEGNLNFSFISPAGIYDEGAQDDIIIAALNRLGINAVKNGRNDLTANGRKFSGNAYGVKNGNKLRHGTLLISSELNKMGKYLTVSAKKLRAKGVSSVRSRVCNLNEFCPELTTSSLASAIRCEFERYYGMEAETWKFSPADSAEIAELRTKRSAFDWVMGEAPAFDYSFEERFNFGTAQLCISVNDGLISRAELYTDSLNTDFSAKIKKTLTGIKFSPENIYESLLSGLTHGSSSGESSEDDSAIRELAEYALNNL